MMVNYYMAMVIHIVGRNLALLLKNYVKLIVLDVLYFLTNLIKHVKKMKAMKFIIFYYI